MREYSGYGNVGGLPLQDLTAGLSLVFAEVNRGHRDAFATIHYICACDSHGDPPQDRELVARVPGIVVLQCSLHFLHLGELRALFTKDIFHYLQEGHCKGYEEWGVDPHSQTVPFDRHFDKRIQLWLMSEKGSSRQGGVLKIVCWRTSCSAMRMTCTQRVTFGSSGNLLR
jgi:hypothetical protein